MPRKRRNSSRPTGNALFIGDTHEPFCLDRYLDHCKRTRDKYKCDTIYHVGDIVDNHAISFHTSDPDGMSAGKELEITIKRLRRWYKAFPQMKICVGNHDARVARVAFEHGLPKYFIKKFLDAFGAPVGYEYKETYKHENIVVSHGCGLGGKYSYANACEKSMSNIVIGHAHSAAGVYYKASEHLLTWGMGVGCGIDRKAYAMLYGKHMLNKPIISCGVYYNGIPIVVPMSM